MANGAAGNSLLTGDSDDSATFAKAVDYVSRWLAREMARDGEGAQTLIEVTVGGAHSDEDARKAARSVAASLLVRTAVYGKDPNWGRILQTVGAGRIRLDLEHTRIGLCGVTVFRAGASAGPAARRRAAVRLADSAEVEIVMDLAAGVHRARIWTCDLSTEYVRINAEYTT